MAATLARGLLVVVLVILHHGAAMDVAIGDDEPSFFEVASSHSDAVGTSELLDDLSFMELEDDLEYFWGEPPQPEPDTGMPQFGAFAIKAPTEGSNNPDFGADDGELPDNTAELAVDVKKPDTKDKAGDAKKAALVSKNRALKSEVKALKSQVEGMKTMMTTLNEKTAREEKTAIAQAHSPPPTAKPTAKPTTKSATAAKAKPAKSLLETGAHVQHPQTRKKSNEAATDETVKGDIIASLPENSHVLPISVLTDGGNTYPIDTHGEGGQLLTQVGNRVGINGKPKMTDDGDMSVNVKGFKVLGPAGFDT